MPPSKRKDDESDDEEYSEDESGEDEDKVMIKKPKVERLDNMKNFKKIIINVSSIFFIWCSDSVSSYYWSRRVAGLESAVLSRRRGLGYTLDGLAHRAWRSYQDAFISKDQSLSRHPYAGT